LFYLLLEEQEQLFGEHIFINMFHASLFSTE
jgi:hypothetical protein